MENVDCSVCKHIKDTLRTQSFSSEPNAFCLHVDIKNFKKENKKLRKPFVQIINKFVCALRNTLGGFILIHLSGQDETDLYLGHFDEVVGPSIRELQQDGDLYINTFRRTWERYDIDTGSVKLVHLEVRKSDVICTSSFNTKVCSDHENTDATILDVLSLLRSDAGSPDNPSPPALRTLHSGPQCLHENRSIQLKRVFQNVLDLASFVDYVWNDLKFTHSLTSMSKVEGGGSFYIGVQELKDNTKATKTVICEGFNFVFTVDEFKEKLFQKIEDEVSVLTRNGLFIQNHIASLNLISIGQHPADDPSKSIVEIAVRYLDGIVFNDKEGPRAYRIKASEICRIQFQEWYKEMKLLTDC